MAGDDGKDGSKPIPVATGKHRPGSNEYQRRRVSEETPLLAAVTDVPYSHPSDYPDETFGDDELAETEINPNVFDMMLSRSTSYSAGIGMEPQSLETAMLRGPRRYSTAVVRRASVAPSRRPSVRRPSTAPSETTEDQSAVQEDEEDVELVTLVGATPFLGGISVGRFWLIFGVVLANTFISCFDMTVMASSHPVITSYFNAANSASWLSTAFLLTSTAFQPLFGRLSDTIGRKSPYVLTIFIFLVATIWCALAQSMTSFILGRAFCGLGAGGTLTLGSIMISDLVPIEIRGAYQSYSNIIYSLGSALGAATGGAIADNLGWRWEFGIQVPILLLALVAAIVAVPADLGMEGGTVYPSFFAAMQSFDYQGSILLTVSVTALILGLNLGGNVFPWSHPIVIGTLVIFAISTPLFVYVESRSDKPIMPLSILSHSPRANLIVSNFLAAIVVNSILFNVPLFFQAVLLESATDSGLRLVVISAAGSISGVSTGFLITWSRKMKWSLIWGAVMTFIGAVCLSLQNKSMPTWLLILFLTPAALGQGFQFPGTFMCILAVSDHTEQAVVTSTLILWRSLGMVLGVALSSLSMQNCLVYFLNQYVTGPLKDSVILEVRQSIEAIATLPSNYREQVIDAYASSLRVTFIGSAVLAFIAILVVVPVKIPRLGKRIEIGGME